MVTPSIKNNGLDIRVQGLDRHTVSEIHGPVQKRPTDFLGALCNSAFQQVIIKFLVGSLEDDANSNIIQDFQIYATFKTEGENARKVEETSLKCSYEEVDSRMLFHAKLINSPNTLVKRTSDIHILVITLGNMSKPFQGLKPWLRVGLTANNTLRYITMNKRNQSLRYRLCCVLPDYQAFAGCEFTASFSRKGKVNPLKKLRKNAMAIRVFCELGEKETVNKK